MTKLNYIICYPPGSSGRFITSVVYKTSNKLDEYILTTKENSGHLEHENKIIPGFHPLENNNHPFVFKQLKRQYLSNSITAFSTHAYPKIKIIRDNSELSETRFIIILYDEDDHKELTANFIIKSIIQRISEILNSDKTVSEFTGTIYYGSAVYVIHELARRFRYEITLDNLFDIASIQNMYDIIANIGPAYSHERPKFLFPGTHSLDELGNRMLKIRYKDIFKKTKNSYVALEQISDFLEVPVPLKIFESYEKYVTDQTTMMTTYFPWLDLPRLHKNT